MTSSLDITFSPADFAALAQRELRAATCVVFDVLRATSSMVTALAHGAGEVRPAADIPEALALKQRFPEALLAGERGGVRIPASMTGGIEFDLGNSPREFTAERVAGKTLIWTTTNGTRALRACDRAQFTLLGAFLNLQSVAAWIARHPPPELVLVCSGTLEQTAYEDVIAAGALADRLWPQYASGAISDSSHLAREAYRTAAPDLLASLQRSRNARRLLRQPELRDDVAWCLSVDRLDLLAALGPDGAVRSYATEAQ